MMADRPEQSALTAFDCKDEVDRKLLDDYRAHDVPTRIELLDRGRHGTFNQAFLARRVADLLRWLCED